MNHEIKFFSSKLFWHGRQNSFIGIGQATNAIHPLERPWQFKKIIGMSELFDRITTNLPVYTRPSLDVDSPGVSDLPHLRSTRSDELLLYGPF
jgi:hypothetical protein